MTQDYSAQEPKHDASLSDRPWRRWYDDKPPVAESIRMIELFPPDIQGVIAKAMALLAERECQAKELMQSFRSLGPEKVMALYKSKKKLRRTDQDPLLHKALNYLSILSAENQLFMAKEVKSLMRFIQHYLLDCRQAEVSPVFEDVSAIGETYVRSGQHGAKLMLDQIRQMLNERDVKPIDAYAELLHEARLTTVHGKSPLKPKPAVKQAEAARGEDITDDDSGMRVTFN